MSYTISTMITRPMLAAKLDSHPDMAYRQLKNLRYPLLGSVKIDGIRAHQFEGVLYSRRNKRIPNLFTQEIFSSPFLSGADGELVEGKPNTPTCFNRTSSAVMSQDGHPDVSYYIFDSTRRPGLIYRQRQADIVEIFEHSLIRVIQVEQKILKSVDEVQEFEEESVVDGWEGIMLRSFYGPYKMGRSTLNEGWLVKVKRFLDSEAVILGAYEQESNLNEAKINEVGLSKRSSHKANKIANGHLGGFNARDLETGVEFNIGNFDGITKDERKLMWDRYLENPECFTGLTAKYKYFPVGVKDKPRHPTFLGFRKD